MGVSAVDVGHGRIALISDEDRTKVAMFRWHSRRSKRGSYYARSFSTGTLMLMHRLILNTPSHLETDHKNGNGLDNRQENLRIATRTQNICNSRRQRWKAPYRGLAVEGNKYRARISFEGKTQNLGLYDSPEEAARVYDSAARKIHGDFAQVNFK